jgi:hypothetical protein
LHSLQQGGLVPLLVPRATPGAPEVFAGERAAPGGRASVPRWNPLAQGLPGVPAPRELLAVARDAPPRSRVALRAR